MGATLIGRFVGCLPAALDARIALASYQGLSECIYCKPVRSADNTMDAKPQNIIPSGIEPVDSVIGGLESGELYFVHGEASGKSLFGISFLIGGLKRGEHGALVTRCSPGDAVNQFARIGYDCLEDLYGGRLVIIESSDHLIQQTTGPGQLAPALRELEWLLGASRPRRLVFDPVTSEAVSDPRGLEARVGEFAQWTRQLGATVVLIANEDNSQIAELFKRHVAESFRFEVRDALSDRATPFIAFEKSLTLPARPIQVDPSRGIFLSERVEDPRISPTFFSTSGADSRLVDIDSPARKPSQARPIAGGPETTTPKARRDYGRINEMAPLELDLESIDDAVARLVERKDQNGAARPQQFLVGPPQRPDESFGSEREAAEELDLTSELFGELTGVIFPGDLSGGQASPLQKNDVLPMANEGSERTSRPLARKAPERRRDSDRASNRASSRQDTSAEPTVGSSRPQPAKRARASDLRIEAAMTASAVDSLLGRSKTAKTPPEPAPSVAPAEASPAQNSVDAKSFKVLVINDDAEPCEIIVQSLMDFTIEQTNDGVSGLAGLISYEPDLVVLDLDIPIVDGFKVLAHIRASLNVPVIIVSSTLAQKNDRLRPTESETEGVATMDQLSKALAASGYYHLTSAFSTKELRDKARQLIARYRGVDAWIISPPARGSETARSTRFSDTRTNDQPHSGGGQDQHQSVEAQGDWLTPYDAFVMELERRVKAVIDNGSALSLVGCRVPQIPRSHNEIAQFRLREVIRDVVRDTDLASANAPGEVVILLADARASGARAFANRLREIVAQKMNQEPSVWMRSFPELEETREAATVSSKPTNGNVYRRRASDRQARV